MTGRRKQGGKPMPVDDNRPDGSLEYAPIAWIELEPSSLCISAANELARHRFNLMPGVAFQNRIHQDFAADFETFLDRDDMGNMHCSLLRDDAETDSGTEVRVQLIRDRFAGGRAFWLRDEADLGALRRQLTQRLLPSRKRLRNLRQQLTTALGYSELVQAIITDLPDQEEKTVASLARYHGLALEQLQAAATELATDSPRRRPIPRIRKHILVVDDEEIMTSLMSELMKAAHHKVTSLTSARSALKAIAVASGTYDLALIDHEMPDMNGTDMAMEVHRLDKTLPMVLYSHQDRSTLPAIPGVRHILAKPLDLSELSQVINGVLEE